MSYAGFVLISSGQVSTPVAQSLHDLGALGIVVPENVVLTGIVFIVGAIIGDCVSVVLPGISDQPLSSAGELWDIRSDSREPGVSHGPPR